MRDDSVCSKNKYCSFELEYVDISVRVERCDFCHKRVAYKLSPKGDPYDSMKYRRDHIRHSAQPFGATSRVFYEVYGKEPVKALELYKRDKEAIEKRKKDFDDNWEELVKWAVN